LAFKFGDALFAGEGDPWFWISIDFYLKKAPPPVDEIVFRPCFKAI
jgi:hypothetical protein